MTRIIIIGAGGHAKVVADAILSAAESGQPLQLAGFVDDNPALARRSILGHPVLGTRDDLDAIDHDAIVIAVGDNRTRARLASLLAERGARFITVIHPSAVIGRDVKFGVGVVVLAHVVVNVGTEIGDHVILNTACSVDHDNRIGACVHMAPGVRTGGDVHVGAGTLVGVGASILPQRSVGAWAIVGAGAVIHRDVIEQRTVAGVPAIEVLSPTRTAARKRER